MNTILFFDTETTGLTIWGSPSEHPDQPRVTQLAAELCIEETGETVGAMNMLVRPDGWTIPEELQALTGITMERANRFGLPIEDVLNAFFEMWTNADIRCAHGDPFDMRMLRIEIMRHPHYSTESILADGGAISFADYWKSAPAFCTIQNSVKILNLPPTAKMLAAKRNTPKSPNLAEAYEFFTGLKLEGAHNAQVDIMAAKAVYYGIKKHLAEASAA